MPSHYHRMMDDVDKKATKSKGKSKGALRHIHIEKANNGYTVNHRLEDKKKDAAMSYEEPKQSVFQSKADVLKHISKLMPDDEAESDE
jgi:hypothetical protein